MSIWHTSDETYKSILEKGSVYWRSFLLDGEYEISEGILYLRGGLQQSYEVANNSLMSLGKPVEYDEEGLRELLEIIHIDKGRITESVNSVGNIFKKNKVKNYIVPSRYYLERDSTSTTYKLSSYKIIK